MTEPYTRGGLSVPLPILSVFSYFSRGALVGMQLIQTEFLFLQDLLQMQYEGAIVMNVFGKAKINVNLLLHFLNTKFYGRRKWGGSGETGPTTDAEEASAAETLFFASSTVFDFWLT